MDVKSTKKCWTEESGPGVDGWIRRWAHFASSYGHLLLVMSRSFGFGSLLWTKAGISYSKAIIGYDSWLKDMIKGACIIGTRLAACFFWTCTKVGGDRRRGSVLGRKDMGAAGQHEKALSSGRGQPCVVI